jgi:RNA polymerase sigma-70 factor, ECF subfamily
MKAKENTSDAELIQAYQAGRPRAFDRLLERYQAPLFGFILRWVQDKPVAEDLFQETFLRVIRALPDYDEQGKFSSWLFGIAHHLCMDHHRKTHQEQRVFNATTGYADEGFMNDYADETLSPCDMVERQELSGIIALALEEMPANVKEVFLLRQHGELAFREIATLLQRPLNTVLGQMRQAVLYIRHYVGKQYV